MLYLHHSNKLTQLVEILLEQMHRQQPGVFQAEQILVQNPGIKRWLQQQISRNQGIAANLEFPLPSRFIWDIFLDQFDVEQLSAYDDEVLRWALMQLLEQHRDDPALRVLRPYLLQQENELAGFQLAQKLASIFNQYLVYRPAMVAQWEQGKPIEHPIESWQAYLWNLLRAQQPEAHRAELIRRLIDSLRTGQADIEALPGRVSVFAISAMSPLYMDVLAELGRHIDIHIFILNPCQHYWGDLQDRKELISQGQITASENELLASLGKQGRDYIDQFYDRDYRCEDNFEFVDIAGDCLLRRVQRQILTLEQDDPDTDFRDDHSIQVISCYSELRELQVLHDQLLWLLDQDHSLQPHDIVVMCPDINTLAPYIEAVFGEQPENRRIPFSISDHDELASSPLFQAILQWINLSSSRFTASELLSWLELPALQRAYAIDENDLDIIRHWVTSTHIHWGYDRRHKQKLGLGDNEQNSWIQGISQLLTRYLMHEEVDMLEANVASDNMISNAELHALGRLHRLLDDLSAWRDRLEQPLKLAQWQQHINHMLDTFLKLDDDEEWLIKSIRNELADWLSQSQQAGFDASLSAGLVQHMLRRAMLESSAQHHYLSGGINFCNLIPMRTLPFRIVCLIGMNDEHFPRLDVPLQFDLITMYPEKGDRSRREDDRYMFLQSLISAQDMFYLSFIGKNKKDDSAMEPSVAVSELIDYVEQSTGYRIPIRSTPLQAFSHKNFELGSYAELWLPKSLQAAKAFDQPIEQQPAVSEISLQELVNFYRNPVKYYMVRRLNMSLYEASAMIDDEETFDLDPLSKHLVHSTMLQDLWLDKGIRKDKYLNSGSLGQQRSGELQFEELKTHADEIYRKITAHPNYQGHVAIQASIDIGDKHLHGTVASYSSSGILQFSLSRLSGRQVFGWWIQHCVLSALDLCAFSEFLFRDGNGRLKKLVLDNMSSEQAGLMLEQIVDGYSQGINRQWPLYIDSAFEYEKFRLDKNEQQAWMHLQKLWSDDGYRFFAEARDIYIRTGRRHDELFPDEFFSLSSRYMVPLLQAMEESAW